MRWGLTCLVGALLWAGFFQARGMAAEPVYVEGAATRALRFGTVRGREAAQQPKRATIFRVMAATPTRPATNGPFATVGAVALGESVDLTAAQMAALAEIFTSPEGYTEGHRCVFEPAVAIRVVGDWTTVDFVLCFACNDAKVVQGEQIVDFAGFTMHRAALLRIVKEAYPRDTLIRALR